MKSFKLSWNLSKYIIIVYKIWTLIITNANASTINLWIDSNVSNNNNSTFCLDKLNNYTNAAINYIPGSVMISIISIDSIPIKFLLNQVNSNIEHNITIGAKTITLKNRENIQDILLQEVQYQQQCTNNSFGILIADELWSDVELIAEDLEYDIWKLESIANILFPMVAHLLYELPWNSNIDEIDVKASTFEMRQQFSKIAQNEHMCLKQIMNNKHMNDKKIARILIGVEMLNSIDENSDEKNGAVFAIPLTSSDDNYIKNLPNGSYIFMESEFSINNNHHYPHNHAADTIGKKYRIANFLIISSAIINLSKHINESVAICNHTDETMIIDQCFNKTSLPLFEHTYKINEILQKLDLNDSINEFNIDLIRKIEIKLNDSNLIDEFFMELRHIASMNVVSDVTTFYHYRDTNESIMSTSRKFGQHFKCSNESFIIHASIDNTIPPSPPFVIHRNNKTNFFEDSDYLEMYWRIKSESWVAAGITISALGTLICLAILIFIIARIYMEDVLEGNPIGTIALLISLMILFASFTPFSIEYTSDRMLMLKSSESMYNVATLCSMRIFLVTLCYCLIFSLLLCRALMLASIGSEGGFLSHVNGYVQCVICLFSTFVQIGLSTQLIIVMHAARNAISCEEIYYGYWFWALLAYDGFLLIFLVVLSPCIIRSQRNYREGLLIPIGTILCLTVWMIWIPLSELGDKWREATVPLGLQATGWAVLVGILIPRTFLVVRGIARSDLAQALPSLASLAFAQNNQYASEQSIYECVNPAMRQRSTGDDLYADRCQSPSEIPTLPLRGASRKNQNPMSCASSQQSTLPATPNKATRF